MGHVLTAKEERAPEKALTRCIEGRRPVGRPRERWVNVVDKDDDSML
jgi:hypothetical protein